MQQIRARWPAWKAAAMLRLVLAWIYFRWLLAQLWAGLCYVLMVWLCDPFGMAWRPLPVGSHAGGRAQGTFGLLDVLIMPPSEPREEAGLAVSSATARRLLGFFWRSCREQTRQNLATLLAGATGGRALICRGVYTRPGVDLPTSLVLELDPLQNRLEVTHLALGASSPPTEGYEPICVHTGTFRLNGADLENVLGLLLGRRPCPRAKAKSD